MNSDILRTVCEEVERMNFSDTAFNTESVYRLRMFEVGRRVYALQAARIKELEEALNLARKHLDGIYADAGPFWGPTACKLHDAISVALRARALAKEGG